MDHNKVDLSISLSKDAHHTDRYAKQSYFDYHIEGVVSIVKYNFKESYTLEMKNKLIIVAYLHDILEDHPEFISYEMIKTMFSKEIADAILAISKNADLTTIQYLSQVKANELARIVKIADSTFNMYNCIIENNYKRAKKYQSNIEYLNAT